MFEKRAYESIDITTYGARGYTFGCSCCSNERRINTDELVTQLTKTASMYRNLTLRYNKLAELAGTYDLPPLVSELRNHQQALKNVYWHDEGVRGNDCGMARRYKEYDRANLISETVETASVLMSEHWLLNEVLQIVNEDCDG